MTTVYGSTDKQETTLLERAIAKARNTITDARFEATKKNINLVIEKIEDLSFYLGKDFKFSRGLYLLMWDFSELNKEISRINNVYQKFHGKLSEQIGGVETLYKTVVREHDAYKRNYAVA